MPSPPRQTIESATLPRRPLLIALVAVALAAPACSDRTLLTLSGRYTCQSPQECPESWSCQPGPQGANVCVAPGDDPFGPAAPDGGGSGDGSVLPPGDDVGAPPGDATPGSPYGLDSGPPQPDCSPGGNPVACQSAGWFLRCGPDNSVINEACDVGDICDADYRAADDRPCRTAYGVRVRIEAYASIWEYSIGQPGLPSAGARVDFVRDSAPGPTRRDPAPGRCELGVKLANETNGGVPFDGGRVQLIKDPEADLPDLLELIYDPAQGYVATLAPDELEPGPCIDCAYRWMPYGGALQLNADGFVVGSFEDQLELPAARTLVEPALMSEVRRSALTVRWEGAASRAGDLVLLSLESYAESRWRIICAPEDTGELTVPADLLAQLPNGELFIELTSLREKRIDNLYGEVIAAGRHYHSRPVLLTE